MYDGSLSRLLTRASPLLIALAAAACAPTGPSDAPEAVSADARPSAARPSAARPDAARPDAARPDAARPDALQAMADVALTVPEATNVVPTADLGPCDPLVPEHCGFPFPNNFWLRNDTAMPSGYRIAFQEDTLPKDRTGSTIDPTEWNGLDGFSAFSPAMTFFKDVVLDNVPHHWDLARSLEADSPTVLLDAVTGERLPHWAELNESGDDPQHKAFMIWPLKRLQDSHRYIVAIRDLRNTAGELIAPSAAFKAQRDDVPTTDPNIEGRRDAFRDIFTRLEAAGVDREDLQIAWDFNTASRENITGRLVAARDDALQRVGAAGPKYRIQSIEDDYSENIYRKITGFMQAPLYLNTPLPEPGLRLVLDGDDKPVFQGYAKVHFTVLIPRSLVENKQPGRLLQYGHGLFGSQGEVESGYLQAQANHYGYVLFATEWWGMSQWDVVNVAWMMLTDITDFPILPDRLSQGIVNKLMLMRMMSGDFAKDPAVTFDGVSVINPNQRSYYGNSQGGIMGGLYMAATTDVQYGTLGVPGAPYALLLPRSADFDPFYAMLKGRFKNGLDQILLISLMQMLWDRAEPAGYLDAIQNNPLPNTPKHRVLFQYGLADAQVSYLGAYAMARSVDAVMFEGNPEEGNEYIYGIPFVPADSVVTDKNVIVGWDYGMPDVPVTNTPPNKDNDTHEKPRREANAQEQMNLFLRTGQIKNFCDGGCDPQ